MADQYQAKIPDPLARRLADISGVLADLHWVRQACHILLPLIDDPQSDTVLMEAIQLAAIVRYCRCHTTGVRTAFLVDGALIGRLPDDLQNFHHYIDTVRDMHIAHSVNDWELNLPYAIVRVDGDAREVVEVRVQTNRMIGLASTDIESLQALASELYDLVDGELGAERERVLHAARELPIEKFERRALHPAPIPGIGPVDKARRR